MVDFHTHILPGVDDGSGSIAESMQMLRVSRAQGVSHVVATPHFYPDRINLQAFLRRREQAEAVLRTAMAAEPGLPELIVGAEVHFFRGMSQSDALQALTVGTYPLLLVEMPLCRWTDAMYRELEDISRNQGITPVIAHIERYLGGFSGRSLLRKVQALPVLVQASGDFFLSRGTESLAMGMLKAGGIHLLGSDCHNMKTRKPNLGAAAERIAARLGNDGLERIRRSEGEILGVWRPV